MKNTGPDSPIHAPAGARFALAALPCAALMAMAHPALAQTSTGTLPTVTVTGQETPVPLREPASTGSYLGLTPMQTPASVEAITRDQLDERGDTSLNDAITRSTGITSLGHPGNSFSALSARGFTDSTSVMRLYDGMRQYGGVAVSFPFDTWSIDRIEVLRGPSSVIYGDGAIGGVVNVIPRKPVRGPIQSEVQLGAGTDGVLNLGFDSAGAINDVLSYRLDVSGNRSDGWVARGDSSDFTFSGALQLDPTPDLSLRLSYAQGVQKPMQYFGSPLVDGQPLRAIRDNNYNVEDARIKFDDRWTELYAQWTPNDSVRVRSRLYHVDSQRDWRNAEAYTYNPATGLVDRSDDTQIRHDQSQTGNTTDATFKGRLLGLGNQVSVGFDVNSASFQHTNNTYTGVPDPASVDLYNPVAGTYRSSVPFIPRYRNKADQYAVFAEDRLELNSQWSVIAGLRYDHARVNRTNLLNSVQQFDTTYAETGWRLGTVYQVMPDWSLYAQYSKAADPVSALLMLSPANSAFSMATGRQVEIGTKNTFWDQRGEWTLALYSIEKDNLLTRDPTNPSQQIQVGQRSSKGIESTLSMQLGKTVQLDANVALLRARYDDFSEPTAAGLVSRDGNVPTDVPEQTANLWMSWRFQPQWTLSGGLRYVGKRFADAANTLELPAYTTADLALQWRATAATSIALRGYNIFDKLYYTTAYYTPTQWLVGEGRKVEVVLNHRF